MVATDLRFSGQVLTSYDMRFMNLNSFKSKLQRVRVALTFVATLEKKKKIKTHPAEILVACRTQADLTEVGFLKLGTFEPGMLSQIACPDKESATHPITPELSFKEISLQPFPLQRLASQATQPSWWLNKIIFNS